MIDRWLADGGTVTYGADADTSCFLLVRDDAPPQDNLWPVVLYPVSGRIEVVFQHLSRRAPIDDIGLRRKFLDLLNGVPGAEIAEVKLDLGPAFPWPPSTARERPG
ncbi:hypothetical protein HNR12_004513 [Streptomonospora nanhaiensis]|uniref:Uncharacterized protein n=1 Tax=Streptomonospora nanhaiensis TaxID=1323731 RepID=A0A853BU06_9ACTN|nr:hypothetical protein [Streptomonospora nanhaiensis]NYI98236.1 hypothetical protein [Streptomonospora nanhaiensis]